MRRDSVREVRFPVGQSESIQERLRLLGAFTNKYVGVTARLSTMSYPNGRMLTNTYFGNTGDERLQEILNQASAGSTVSKFHYTYDSEGEITSWTQQMNSSPSSVYNFQYDAASQLVEALQTGGGMRYGLYHIGRQLASNKTMQRTWRTLNSL